MDWKKRGIQLKSLRPDDPGHLTLCEDLVRISSLTSESAPMDEAEPEPPVPELAELPPEVLARDLRQELEEALGLLEEAIAVTDRPEPESGTGP
jgi:hypothetical protein